MIQADLRVPDDETCDLCRPAPHPDCGAHAYVEIHEADVAVCLEHYHVLCEVTS